MEMSIDESRRDKLVRAIDDRMASRWDVFRNILDVLAIDQEISLDGVDMITSIVLENCSVLQKNGRHAWDPCRETVDELKRKLTPLLYNVTHQLRSLLHARAKPPVRHCQKSSTLSN